MISPRRILIVEDDKYILSAFQDLLNDEGYSVSTASNGQEALDILRASDQLPNLILLDWMMPVKDGLEFRREQSADASLAKIPTVMMSADGAIESRTKGYDTVLHVVDSCCAPSAA
jgi:two-component system phosphate regulon response regulator PhoB